MHVRYNAKKDTYLKIGKVDSFFTVELLLEKRFSLKDVRKVIDNLAVRGLCRIGLKGKVNSSLLKVMKYIKDKKIEITLECSYSLNKAKISSVKAYVSNIRYSVYGCEGVHDRMVGKVGSFKKLWESIVLAKKYGIPVYLSSTLVKSNITETECLVHFCLGHEIKLLSFYHSYDKEEMLPQKVIEREIRQIKNLAGKFEKKLKVRVGERLVGKKVVVYPDGKLVISPVKNKLGCKALGNLLKEDVSKIWEKYEYKENYVKNYLGRV